MELFAIQCTTCRARLKVNDPSVIGDILACPKCGSMVHVVPPEQMAGSPGESAKPDKRGTERPAAKKAAAVPPVLPQRTPANPLSASASSAALPPLPATASAVGEQARAPVAMAAAASAAHVSTSPARPAAAAAIATAVPAVSLAGRLWNDYKLLAGALAGGITLGAMSWIAIGIMTREDAATVAVAPQDGVTQPHAATKNVDERVRIAQEPIEETVVADETTVEAVTDPSTSDEATPVVESKKEPPVADNDSEPAAPEAARAADRPAAAIKLEPAEHARPAPQTPPTPSVADEPEPAHLGERVGDAPANAPPSERESDSSGALPARALTSDEIDERLSGPLPKVRFVKVPLGQFVDFINDFSGLVIVIDERALAKVSKSRQTPVTVKLADTTARDALRSAVTSLGLTCVVRDGQMVITAVSK